MNTNDKKERNFEKDGVFYVLGSFDDSISRNIIPALRKKIDEEKYKSNPSDIRFYINSCGGFSYELFGIISELDRAKSHGIKIETNVIGAAYSCGSLLACYGTKGKRKIGKYSEHCLHFGSPGHYKPWTPKQLEREQSRSKRQYRKILEIYKKCTKKIHHKKIEEEMQDDNYFITAEEAVQLGLADNIF